MRCTEQIATELFYRLDKLNRITEVGGAWDEAASANSGGRLRANLIEGTQLLDHISGTETRYFTSTLIDAARRLNKPIVRQYRCDTPTQKRTFAMRLEPQWTGLITIKHKLLSTTPRDLPVEFALFCPTTESNKLSMSRCSWCNRVHRRSKWQEVEELRSQYTVDAIIDVNYVVCHDCYRATFSASSGLALYHSHRAIAQSAQ